MLKRQRGLLVALVLLLCAAGARATIGPPVQVRIVGPIPEFVPGERRIVTIEIATLKNLALESLRVAGKGWTVHSTTLPVSKAMSAGEKLQVQVDASTLDAPTCWPTSGSLLRGPSTPRSSVGSVRTIIAYS